MNKREGKLKADHDTASAFSWAISSVIVLALLTFVFPWLIPQLFEYPDLVFLMGLLVLGIGVANVFLFLFCATANLLRGGYIMFYREALK
jgi:hypothetical protein